MDAPFSIRCQTLLALEDRAGREVGFLGTVLIFDWGPSVKSLSAIIAPNRTGCFRSSVLFVGWTGLFLLRAGYRSGSQGIRREGINRNDFVDQAVKAVESCPLGIRQKALLARPEGSVGISLY